MKYILKFLLPGIFLFFVSAASFYGFYSRFAFFERGVADTRRDFKSVIDEEANRPYVYRQLLPWGARTLKQVVPQKVQSAISNARNEKGQSIYEVLFSTPASLDPHYSFMYLVFYAETSFFAFLAACSLFALCRFVGIPQTPSLCAAGSMIILMPYFQAAYYDYSELFFLSLGLILAMRFKWWWLLPVSVVATLNKESYFFFLFSLYPLLRARYPRLKSLAISSACVLSSGFTYSMLRHRYAQNPGGAVEWWLPRQVDYLVHILPNSLKRQAVYGIELPTSFSLLPIAVLILIYAYSRKHVTTPLRRQTLLTFCILAPLVFLFCYPGETRNWSLLFPNLAVFMATCFQRLEQRQEQTEHAQPSHFVAPVAREHETDVAEVA